MPILSVQLNNLSQSEHTYVTTTQFKKFAMLCLVAQSCLTLCHPTTATHQAPLFMGFSRQEYWSGLPCPSPADLPNPGIEPRSPVLQTDSLLSEPPWKPS